MKRIVTVVLLLLGLLLAQGAQAAAPLKVAGQPVATTPAARAIVAKAHTSGFVSELQLYYDSSVIAHNFWVARGVYPPWINVISRDSGGDGYYNWSGNPPDIWINPLLTIRAMYDLDIYGGSSGPPAQGAVCAVETHEFGHSAGLGHTPTGIMRPSGLASVKSDWPWDCRIWARDH